MCQTSQVKKIIFFLIRGNICSFILNTSLPRLILRIHCGTCASICNWKIWTCTFCLRLLARSRFVVLLQHMVPCVLFLFLSSPPLSWWVYEYFFLPLLYFSCFKAHLFVPQDQSQYCYLLLSILISINQWIYSHHSQTTRSDLPRGNLQLRLANFPQKKIGKNDVAGAHFHPNQTTWWYASIE